jgi:hypothetical protein
MDPERGSVADSFWQASVVSVRACIRARRRRAGQAVTEAHTVASQERGPLLLRRPVTQSDRRPNDRQSLADTPQTPRFPDKATISGDVVFRRG